MIQCIRAHKLGCRNRLLTTQGLWYSLLYLKGLVHPLSLPAGLSRYLNIILFLQKRFILHNDRGLTDDERLGLKLLYYYILMCDVAREVVVEARFCSEQRIRITHLNERTINVSQRWGWFRCRGRWRHTWCHKGIALFYFMVWHRFVLNIDLRASCCCAFWPVYSFFIWVTACDNWKCNQGIEICLQHAAYSICTLPPINDWKKYRYFASFLCVSCG